MVNNRSEDHLGISLEKRINTLPEEKIYNMGRSDHTRTPGRYNEIRFFTAQMSLESQEIYHLADFYSKEDRYVFTLVLKHKAERVNKKKTIDRDGKQYPRDDSLTILKMVADAIARNSKYGLEIDFTKLGSNGYYHLIRRVK